MHKYVYERRPKPHSNEQEASFADYAKQARVIMKLFFSLHLTLSAVPFLLAAHRAEQLIPSCERAADVIPFVCH